MEEKKNVVETTETSKSPYSKDERMWGMFCHLSTFAIFFFPTLGNIVAPLIIWLIKKEEYPFVNDQGKEVLNFQISMTLFMIGAGILCIFLIGIPLLIGLAIFDFIVTIIAAVKANDGEKYRYPINIRFID